ncbi:MAG: MoxR family ATPase [Pirellulales bacterium]|jgi:MoxR-like ATPase|nr:MoxR family ATPase [Pirellulales bacterium]
MSDPARLTDLATIAADCRVFAEEFQSSLGEHVILPPSLVEHALVALVAGGHLLLEGNPGMGKQTLARWIARSVGLSFSARTFTPDLRGEDFLPPRSSGGPGRGADLDHDPPRGAMPSEVFYAEDIDEAPRSTIAALVDTIRDRPVGPDGGAGGARPLLVIASRRPAALGAVQTLDPSQLDRFLIQSHIRYPTPAEEWEIARWTRPSAGPEKPLRTRGQLAAFSRAAAALEAPEAVIGYAWALVRATRPGNELAPQFVERWIKLGVSPCGLVALLAAAKARALLLGRIEPTREDVYSMAQPVLGHRLIGNAEAAAANLTNQRLIGILLETILIDGVYARPSGPSDAAGGFF